MAGEQFLLSGDQLATYQGSSTSYPPPDYQTNLTISGISALGSAADRFVLVRIQGSGDPIQNSDLFALYPAVDNGSGTLVPDLTQPLFQLATATPDAYQSNGSDGLGAGDDYLALGLFNGPKILVKLDGINGQDSFTVARGEDVTGNDGEMSLEELTAANPDQVVCFAEGSPIATINGEIPVERLKIGDKVLTYDHGFQPIRWIGSSTVTFNSMNDDLVPIRIEAHAMGRGQPDRTIMVSPAHRILWKSVRAEIMFGEPEVLVAARHMVNGKNVRRETSMKTVTYWHFMFEEHEVVFSAGLKTESFFPAAYGISTMARESRQELLRLFPELASGGRIRAKDAARPVLRAYEFKALQASLGEGQTLT
jgi:hypothetical protein